MKVELINFTLSEFDSPDYPGTGKQMNLLFLAMLQEARTIAGIPFEINSGFRTVSHNKKVGGKSTSSHLKGCAVDIAVSSSRERAIIMKALISVGFTRIGIGKTFIHVDSDDTKSENVFWTYNNK